MMVVISLQRRFCLLLQLLRPYSHDCVLDNKNVYVRKEILQLWERKISLTYCCKSFVYVRRSFETNGKSRQ